MKPVYTSTDNQSRVKPVTLRILLVIVACLVICFILWTVRHPQTPVQRVDVEKPKKAFSRIPDFPSEANPVPPPPVENAPAQSSITAAIPNSTLFAKRPFEVVKDDGAFAWTAEDGRSPEAIQKLAHNPLEAARMMAENRTIHRRQLVYCNNPIADQIQHARASGQLVQNFTLPALDGQTYEVEVTQNNVEPNVAAGSLAGNLKGRPNSIASVGFKDGYQSFNIISPDDDLYLVADAREPGQVMIKEIIPGIYAAPTNPSHAPDYILTK